MGPTATISFLAKIADSGTFMPAKLVRYYAPVDYRRDLQPEESAAVEKGEKQWMPEIIDTDETRIPRMMASPSRQAVLAGGIGAGAGAGIGELVGGNRGAAVGAIGGGLAAALGRYLHQYRRNAHLTETMRRLPPGATKRDLDAEQRVSDTFEEKFSADKRGVPAGPPLETVKHAALLWKIRCKLAEMSDPGGPMEVCQVCGTAMQNRTCPKCDKYTKIAALLNRHSIQKVVFGKMALQMPGMPPGSSGFLSSLGQNAQKLPAVGGINPGNAMSRLLPSPGPAAPGPAAAAPGMGSGLGSPSGAAAAPNASGAAPMASSPLQFGATGQPHLPGPTGMMASTPATASMRPPSTPPPTPLSTASPSAMSPAPLSSVAGAKAGPPGGQTNQNSTGALPPQATQQASAVVSNLRQNPGQAMQQAQQALQSTPMSQISQIADMVFPGLGGVVTGDINSAMNNLSALHAQSQSGGGAPGGVPGAIPGATGGGMSDMMGHLDGYADKALGFVGINGAGMGAPQKIMLFLGLLSMLSGMAGGSNPLMLLGALGLGGGLFGGGGSAWEGGGMGQELTGALSGLFGGKPASGNTQSLANGALPPGTGLAARGAGGKAGIPGGYPSSGLGAPELAVQNALPPAMQSQVPALFQALGNHDVGALESFYHQLSPQQWATIKPLIQQTPEYTNASWWEQKAVDAA